MKIDDVLLGRIVNTGIASNKESQKSDAFAKVLNETQSKETAATEPGSQTGNVSSLLNANPVGRIMATQSINTNQDTYLEKALTSLERFAEALADPNQTMKNIAPIADELGKDAEVLNQTGKKMPVDHPLKSVVDQTAVLAAVESAKFKRGDYI